MGPRQAGLRLDDPRRPTPTRPTLIHAAGGAAWADSFDTLAELCAAALQLAGEAAGLRLAAEPAICAYPGFELFLAWSIYALAPDGDAWLASCAVQDTPRDVLEAAIAAAIARRPAAQPGRAAA